MDHQCPGLGSLPVELFYKVQLYALSDTLPHVCQHLYHVFKSAPPSFHAQYILGRVLADSAEIVTGALRYPLCTMEVLDALCRLTDTASLQERALELPRRLFRVLRRPIQGSEWTEHDHPLPFLTYLYNHPFIKFETHRDFEGYALTKAAHACFLPLLFFLLDHRTCGKRTPLVWAADGGHEEVVRALLARDDIDVNSKGVGGRTPLSSAACRGYEGVVKALLVRDDVDVNSKDGQGRTPLSLAVGRGYEGVVKALLVRDDTDVNSKGVDGRTPLSLAATHGHEGMVKALLLRDDIDVNLKDVNSRTPLSLAACYGHEGVVRALLVRDHIDVNPKDDCGVTPLWLAARHGNEGVVKLLLMRDDLDVNLKDVNGRTLAASRQLKGVVKLLLSRNDMIDVNLKDAGYGC